MPQAGEENIDIVSDLNNGTDEGTQQQQQEAPDDVRSLLEAAAQIRVDEDGRTRDATGKFAKAPEGGEQQQEQQQQGTEQQQQGTEQQQQQQGTFQLTPEYQQLVSGLPEEHRNSVQAALVARETAIATAWQDMQARVTGYAGIEQVIGPRRQAWAMGGITPEAAVNQLFALSDFATRDPRAFVEWFAANNNIDLSEVGETFVPPDPQFSAMQQEIAQLRGTVQQLTTGAQQAQTGQLVQAVQQFENTVDEKGQPKYPHFQAVANDMLAILPSIRDANPLAAPAQLLEMAYDRAVYANPNTRQTLLSAQAAAEAARRTEEARRAGRASLSQQGSAPGAEPNFAPAQADSVRGALEAAFAAHS